MIALHGPHVGSISSAHSALSMVLISAFPIIKLVFSMQGLTEGAWLVESGLHNNGFTSQNEAGKP